MTPADTTAERHPYRELLPPYVEPMRPRHYTVWLTKEGHVASCYGVDERGSVGRWLHEFFGLRDQKFLAANTTFSPAVHAPVVGARAVLTETRRRKTWIVCGPASYVYLLRPLRKVTGYVRKVEALQGMCGWNAVHVCVDDPRGRAVAAYFARKEKETQPYEE